MKLGGLGRTQDGRLLLGKVKMDRRKVLERTIPRCSDGLAFYDLLFKFLGRNITPPPIPEYEESGKTRQGLIGHSALDLSKEFLEYGIENRTCKIRRKITS